MFSSGENNIQIVNSKSIPYRDIKILFKYQQDGSLFQLAMAVDALQRIDPAKPFSIDLYIPYFPGSRQDRVCNEGEALSAKVYANFINSLNFRSVHIFDPHSEVTPALINNVVVHNNYELVFKSLTHFTHKFDKYFDFVLISPDAGSNKKIFELSKKLKGKPVIRCDKKRNLATMEIEDTEIYYNESLKGKVAVIVDDICAGGRTFKEIAKKLRKFKPDNIILIVSFFEGLAKKHDLMESGIDHVYTTDALDFVGENDYFTPFYIDDLMSF